MWPTPHSCGYCVSSLLHLGGGIVHGETGQDGLACRRTCRGRCLATAHLQKATEGGSAACLPSRLWEEGNPIRHPRPLRACHACAYTAGRGTPVQFYWLSCALSHGGASSCRSRTLHPCWGLRVVRHFRLLRYWHRLAYGRDAGLSRNRATLSFNRIIDT